MRPKAGDIDFQDCAMIGMHLVNSVRCDRGAAIVVYGVPDWPEPCVLFAGTVADGLKTGIHELAGVGMQWQLPDPQVGIHRAVAYRRPSGT
jgi:hypothetical protein